MIAPDHRVGGDVPHEGRLAERSQDGRSLRKSGCHNRLVSGHCRVILRFEDSACFGFGPDPTPSCINIPQTTLRSRREQAAEHRHGPCDGRIGRGGHVPKRDSSAGFRLAMSGSDRPEQTVNDGVVADARPPASRWCRWLSRRSGQGTGQPPPRPTSTFVTQLIATADHAPQTRSLRRATAADAQTAYSANRRPIPGAGIRTRHIAKLGRLRASASRRLVRRRRRAIAGLQSRGRDLRRWRVRRNFGWQDFGVNDFRVNGFGANGLGGQTSGCDASGLTGSGCGAFDSGRSRSTDSAIEVAIGAAGSDLGSGSRFGSGLESGSGSTTVRAKQLQAPACPAWKPRQARRHRHPAPRAQRKTGQEIHQRQQRQQEKGRGAEPRPAARNSAAAPPNTISDNRWSVRYFAPGRAPLMTSDSSSRMASASSMSLSVTGQSAPDSSGTFSSGVGEGDVGHQEDDDVVDRERNQKKRKTDHGHRRGLLSS